MQTLTINARVLAVLPPKRAKTWLTPRQMGARDKELLTRSLYASLNYMVLKGWVVRRRDETGRWVYARAPKA